MGLFDFFKKLPAPEFEKISIRGRVAYGICCFENALIHYGIKGEGWNMLLQELWTFSTLPSESRRLKSGGVEFVLERWVDVSELLPHKEYFINEYNYKGFYSKYIVFRMDKEREPPSEQEYKILRGSYKNTNEVINNICLKIYHIGSCELWAGLDNVSRDTLNRLQNLMDYMIENKIQLPEVEPFKKYEYAPKGIDAYSYGWGYTFDGKQYSKFLNLNNS